VEPPGRNCPLSYRYRPQAFARAPELAAESLWIAGGLYGNPFALQALEDLFEKEKGSKALVFNGDFHWFDATPGLFHQINRNALGFVALRGNVETELVESGFDAGCGCAYPEWVDDGTVERSNEIIERSRCISWRRSAVRASPSCTVTRGRCRAGGSPRKPSPPRRA
jgi:hypothetical protein